MTTAQITRQSNRLVAGLHYHPRGLHSRLGVRRLRADRHADRHPNPDQGMGHHAGDHRQRHDDRPLGRHDRHLCISRACRPLRPQAGADRLDFRLFAVFRTDRLCHRLGEPAGASPRSTASRCRASCRSAWSWSPKRHRPNGARPPWQCSSAAFRLATCCVRLRHTWSFRYGDGGCFIVSACMPALLVVWIRIGVSESPRFEQVSAAMVQEGMQRRFDLWSPVRKYPRDMLVASLVYFFYLFTWIGWSAWMPQFLAVEKRSSASRSTRRAISRSGCSWRSSPIGFAAG